MIQINLPSLNDGQVTVDFYHDKFQDQATPRFTTCKIVLPESLSEYLKILPVDRETHIKLNDFQELVFDGELYLIGRTRCSAEDNFCRRTGRKRSFDRALELIEDRGLRMEIRKRFHEEEGYPFIQ